jgi:hypothetical protein
MACPRSGTKYAVEYLRGLGFDVTHETNKGRHGIVDWQWWRWIGVDALLGDPVRFHQIRDPVSVMNSMLTLNPSSRAEMKHYYETEDPQWWWYHHNVRIEQEVPPENRYQVEKFEEALPLIRAALPEIEEKPAPNVSKTINTYRHMSRKKDNYGTLTMDELYPEVRELAEKYGYYL